jgi:hypothetical protein
LGDGVNNEGVSGLAGMFCRSGDALLHGVIEANGGGLHGLLSMDSFNVALLCYSCNTLVDRGKQRRPSGRQISKSHVSHESIAV